MTPSPATRRRPRNNAAVGGTGATARALAAGLWRLQAAGPAARRHREESSAASPPHGGGNKRRTEMERCPCRKHHGIRLPGGRAHSSMEEATKCKWDHTCFRGGWHDGATSFHHQRCQWRSSKSGDVPLLLEQARARIGELEEEKRATSKRLLRKLGEAKEAASLERQHRRQLEAANARLLRELAAERRAREVMEAACSELTRKVEEDQAEVELLRGDVEEERRMLQVAEVWREERVRMKLADARLALEHKYDHLSRLQAQLEAFLRHRRTNLDGGDDVLPLLPPPMAMAMEKEKQSSPAPSSSNPDGDGSVSPATDLFLAKPAGDDPDSDGSCSWVGDRPSVSLSHSNNGSRSGPKNNTALIRRLWRSAIADSRSRSRSGGPQANGGDRTAAAEHCTSSGSGMKRQRYKQSLQEKLTEARMDDRKDKTSCSISSR